MQTVLLIVHLLIAMGVVGLVLMQRSEGGALGMGGGGGGLISGRGAADVLAKSTTALGVLFIITSMTLTLVAAGRDERRSVIEGAPVSAPAPAPAPVQEVPAGPPEPAIRAAPAQVGAEGATQAPPASIVSENARVAPAPPPNAERAAPAAARPQTPQEPEILPAPRVLPEAAIEPAPTPRLPPERAGPDE
jgi:preprotein translocase subunit SecG